MIVKGHDFPDVTLVGIVAADISLYASDYRAAERTFQLLTQAVGRAGRGSKAGEAVIQTYMPEHYSIQTAAKQDYDAFYEQEILYRELMGYPPVDEMLGIYLSGKDLEKLESCAEQLAEWIRNAHVEGLCLIGPADAALARKNDSYRKVIYMKHEKKIILLKIKKLLEQQIAGGTDAIVICGTTGEASALNDTEHLDVIEFACATVNRRLPVIAGTGSNDTRHAVALSREAKSRGADALLQVTPYYNKTSQAGLVRHFNAVADAVGLPMILYNVPSRTGMNIQPETYAELAKHPLIVATKEASGNVSAIAKTAALCGDELAIYSGNDDQILPLLALGGIGVISVLANVAPRETHDICRLYFEGKHAESLALQLRLLELIEALFCDVNPIPVKEAMNLLGHDAGQCRMPLAPLNAANRERLRTALCAAGFLKA